MPEIYSPAHGTWTVAPPRPGEPISCSTNAALLRDRQILYSTAGVRYVLDPRQQCWTATEARLAQPDGILIALLGGDALDLGKAVNEGAPFTGTELFTPTPGTCSVAQRIQASTFSLLAPQGATANAATLRARGYSLSLRAIRRGTLVVDWYTRTESAGRLVVVLVGAGRASTTRDGSLRLALTLTAKGKRLLARARDLRLTANGAFTTTSGKTVTATRRFTLNG
jgi:hypothetical protein